MNKDDLRIARKIYSKAAQELGSLGGKARARNLSREELSEIGRKAGQASAAKRKLNNKEQGKNGN